MWQKEGSTFEIGEFIQVLEELSTSAQETQEGTVSVK